jgi:hypothetical protein
MGCPADSLIRRPRMRRTKAPMDRLTSVVAPGALSAFQLTGFQLTVFQLTGFQLPLHVPPVVAHTHVGDQRDTQLHHMLHLVPHQLLHRVHLRLRHIKHQLVVHLESHPCL